MCLPPKLFQHGSVEGRAERVDKSDSVQKLRLGDGNSDIARLVHSASSEGATLASPCLTGTVYAKGEEAMAAGEQAIPF
jgi:hypothetical protein